MGRSLNSWLNDIDLADPIERRQAGLVQTMLIGLLVAVLLALVLVLAEGGDGAKIVLKILALALTAVTAVAGQFLVRRGRFRAGVLTATAGLLLTLTIFALLTGVTRSPSIMLALAVPVAMAGLLLGRRALLGVVGLSAVAVAAVAFLESAGSPLVAAQGHQSTWGITVAGYVVLIGLLGVFFDRFSSSLRETLASSQARERELEALRAGLEEAVAARTAELQASVEQLQASQFTIRELGAPVLPVLPGVLVAPVIGALDSRRASDLAQAVLRAIDRHRARALILDITGVAVVDTQVAQALLKVAQAARLLGSQALLVGVSAEVAQTMVALGVELSGLRVFPNLQEAVLALLPERGAEQDRSAAPMH
ncbi:MAG TPA: STAS domain-containing protein [Roseiflexaceae bacterium]|nr:STAS domain-containing protein [Roseiflexaceae bacterium]